MNNKKYYPTALALYFTYFVHGIGVSILGQYKQNFAGVWGAKTLANGTFDVSIVLAVIAALGLGRLITLPFSGPISDKFGRRISGLIGIALYAAYFIGIVLSPSMYVAYMFALLGGAANSFLDTCVTPSCLEIFVNSGDVANMFTKFSISMSQFLLPFIIGFVAGNGMSYKAIFFVTAALLIIDGILIAFMPFPPMNTSVSKGEAKTVKEKMKFTPTSIAIILIGFTCTSTFQLWLNCNQELGKLYGLAKPSQIQSYYAMGSIIAVLVTAALVKSFIKPVRILVIYPTLATIMLMIIYFIQTPTICLIGGFVIGFTAAGGVLQLAVSTANSMFPTNKGKITSIVMISSSVANYVILNIASIITKSGGVQGPKYVLLFNAVITIVGILLALFVNRQYAKAAM
ncbi:MFS transporter [Clostridiaceae bacterium UIB06]|uniref:MFS transporter n=1 Tax=Clostridium thailandense TaxID=2794346 RepID=A0A949TM16_9CLOT|nr:MFS transporter [Clostridium thailandense]MBV7272927.1 MFS transporter [Clostridium thailandense]MCH5136262.1 MFS transporter [Clostridiaceae bacterium UIB06]